MGEHDIELVGVNDPHIGYDRYEKVAGPASDDVALTMGLVHAPYQRVLDAMVGDGASVVLAGHTHGGQLAVPLCGCARDELRPRHQPRQGRLPMVAGRRVRGPSRRRRALVPGSRGCRVAARLRRPGHLALRAGALRVPPRGDVADPAGPRRLSQNFRVPGWGSGRFQWARSGRLSSGVAVPPGAVNSHGVWRSLVARVVRDDEAAGSNPVTPTDTEGPLTCRHAGQGPSSCLIRATYVQ